MKEVGGVWQCEKGMLKEKLYTNSLILIQKHYSVTICNVIDKKKKVLHGCFKIKLNLGQLMYVVFELRGRCLQNDFLNVILAKNSDTPRSRNLDTDILNNTQAISKVVTDLHKVSVWWLNIVITHKIRCSW